MTERVYTQTFGVVGAIVEKDGKILLVKENDPKTLAVGKWNQPAGWIDVGQDPIEAVIREVKEETGLDFRPTALLGIYSLMKVQIDGSTRHAIKLIFRGDIKGGEIFKSNDEIQEVRWFDPADIERMSKAELRDPDIKQEVKDYFGGTSYPLDIIHHHSE